MTFVRLLLVVAIQLLVGCSSSDRSIGSACDQDEECKTRFCHYGVCLDAEGDPDGDGLSNQQERLLGTFLFDRDSDDDGIPDGIEVGDVVAPLDADGDGILDCLESDDADADGDCLADQFDSEFGGPAPADELTERYCSAEGVCGQGGVIREAECNDGVVRCVISGEWYESNETLCDGLDNDCDGRTDEDLSWRGISVGESCVADGQCGAGGAVGIVECNLGATTCSTSAGGSSSRSQQEVCNGLDDDCDGFTDEDLTSRLGGIGEVCAGIGVCPAGVLECQGGDIVCSTLVGGSQYLGSSETCNGVDDDCDGLTDEDFQFDGLSVGSGCGEGVCAGGVVECAPSGLGARCSSSVVAGVPELCNGVDDDCDGLTDETSDLNPKDAKCPEQGVCGEPDVVQALCTQGTWSCEAGESGLWQLDVETSCDGLDNDCDGLTDEHFEYIGSGVGTPLLVGEACGVGVCAGGTVTCTPDESAVVCTTASQAALEVCDGLDNDCDGTTDEEQFYGTLALGEVCSGVGACGEGEVVCSATSGVAVCSSNPDGTSSEATPEICNSLDDDCDGETDEWEDILAMEPSCAGAGICAEGGGMPMACSAGTLVCDLGAISGTELPNEVTCNGKDDDCDGSVDEGLLTSLGTSVTPWFAGQPTARTGSANAGDGSQIYSYGGVLTGAQNKTVGELWSLDLSLGKWTRRITLGPARSHASLTSVDSQYLYLIGGVDAAGESTDQVKRIKLTAGNPTASGVGIAGQFTTRANHRAIYDPDAKWIWVIGGTTAVPGQATAALNVSDPQNLHWVAGIPEAPGWRNAPAVARIPSSEAGAGGQVVVFGGASEDGWDPTTWVLNTSEGGWTPLELSGPSPRYGASMVWHNGDLWLYGGVSAVESVLSDVWRFDPTTYTWTLSASDASAGARAFHSLFSLDLGLTIFAGTGNGAIAGSTWSATSEALDWSVVPLQDTPSVRRGASLFAVGQNRLWLAGGVGTSGAPKVDVWKATVSADATDWEQFQPPFPATLDSAVAYRPDTEVIYIHGGKDTDGTSVSELWSWSPVSGPVITSTGLPTASQHAMVWDAAGSRLLGHHAGLLWSWDADTDDFGALPTNGDVPTTAVGQRLFLTDDGTTLYLFDSLQSTLWSLQVASGYWSVVATGLEISASAPMWMVGDELVGVSESAVLHISGTTGAIATKFVNNVEAISGDAALAFHPALGSLFSAGGVKHPVEEQQFQPGGVRLPYVCPQ